MNDDDNNITPKLGSTVCCFFFFSFITILGGFLERLTFLFCLLYTDRHWSIYGRYFFFPPALSYFLIRYLLYCWVLLYTVIGFIFSTKSCRVHELAVGQLCTHLKACT